MPKLFVVYRKTDGNYDAERCDCLRIKDGVVKMNEGSQTLDLPLNQLIAVLPVSDVETDCPSVARIIIELERN